MYENLLTSLFKIGDLVQWENIETEDSFILNQCHWSAFPLYSGMEVSYVNTAEFVESCELPAGSVWPA